MHKRLVEHSVTGNATQAPVNKRWGHSEVIYFDPNIVRIL